MTTHANSRILPPGGQGDARPTARGRSPVANAKIISIVDHEVAAVLRLTAKDLEAERDKTQRDIAFVADNLRHDIKTRTQNFGRDAHALAVVQDKLRQDINTIAAAVNQLRQDVDALKQGHQAVGSLSSVDQLKQGGATPDVSD